MPIQTSDGKVYEDEWQYTLSTILDHVPKQGPFARFDDTPTDQQQFRDVDEGKMNAASFNMLEREMEDNLNNYTLQNRDILEAPQPMQIGMKLPTPANDNKNLQIPIDPIQEAIFKQQWESFVKKGNQPTLTPIPGGRK